MSHELKPGCDSVDGTDQRRHYMIVSDDSDLVLIGLCMSSLYRVDVSLLHRSPASSGPDCFERFSTAGFFDRLRRSFPHDPPGRVALDFVFLVLLTGNDYLPCLDKAKIQNLWCTYRGLKGADPPDDDAGPPARAGQYLYDPASRMIDSAFFATFLLANSSLFPYASSKPVPIDSTSDSDDDDDEEENESASKYVTKEKTPVVQRDEETGVSTAPRALSLPSAEMYLYGLEWNMRMYLDFRCPNYDYFYPSWDAPSPRALVEQLQRLARRKARGSKSAGTRSPPSATASTPSDRWPADPLPLPPYQFCLALMPPWGKEYLPEALQQHCEVVDDIESALFMNPGDLVDSRRLVVQGLDVHTPTATATTTMSSSSLPIASAFTSLEERTLSFASHFFYERWVRRERPRSAERTTKKRRRAASQEPEEAREMDEFGRDVDLRTRKRKKKKKKKKKEGKKEKGQKQEKEVEETEKEAPEREEIEAATGQEQGGPAQEERRGTTSSEGFNIETPLGMAALPPADLLLLRYGTIARPSADGYAAI